MFKTTKLVVPAALAMCVFAGFMLALGARPAPPAAIIAVVDLEKVFAGLAERADMEDQLNALRNQAQAKLDAMQENLTKIDSELSVLGEGPAKKAKMAERARLFANARVELEVSKQLLALDEGTMAREIYNKIDAAAEKVAKQRGFTMVLASDETATIPDGVTKKEVDRFASAKKMLYVDPSLDITPELITLMNNEYKANVSAPAPAAPGAGSRGR